MRSRQRSRPWPASVGLLTLFLLPAAAALPSAGVAAVPGRAATASAIEPGEVPEVLQGDTWLRHHREDLMPYWDLPEALGVPVGNFPSFRGRAGELLPESTNRGLSTLARGVYGYSLAFHLTGQERYLDHARAGLRWIETKAKDPVHGGYFGELDLRGDPVDPTAHKDVFDLASLGLAYGMYFNVTRDPAAEAGLLAVRDLVFDEYVDPAGGRVLDAVTYDLSTEVDTGGNGGDLTNLLVPATAFLLPYAEVLTDPARRDQFRTDLRWFTQVLLDRHKNSAAASNRWWFWGRTGRFGSFNAPQTDFGHNIKAYELIHHANLRFPDRPWDGLAGDRAVLLGRAWDDAAARWNQRLRSFGETGVEPDSGWWIHNEADQTLAALNLDGGFVHRDWLARSAQSWLDVYVDRDPAYPVRETFARVERTGAMTDLRKSFFGKNMLHAHEHALIMYLHGRALERRPARLYYALPADRALDAVATPYWFPATGQQRTVRGRLPALPGHRLVEVDFTGLDDVVRPPYPPPEDGTPPVTVASISPAANDAGWHRDEARISLAATDDEAGVKEIHVRVQERTGRVPDTAVIVPGEEYQPRLAADGDYLVTYFAVDALGNAEAPHLLRIRVDTTAPALSGLPSPPCLVWPPNRRMVTVADVAGTDLLSGMAAVQVDVTSDEASGSDIAIEDGRVRVRAWRTATGDGRVYSLTATAVDRAGNRTRAEATCVVPHDARPE